MELILLLDQRIENCFCYFIVIQVAQSVKIEGYIKMMKAEGFLFKKVS